MLDRKMNVMHVIGDLDRAGAQEVVRTLIEYLALDSCTPVVCTLKDGPLRHDIEELGISVEVLSPRRYSVTALPQFIADILRIRRQLVHLIKKYHIDIIQTHLLGILDFLVLTLRYDTNLRVVLWTIHNVNFLPKRPGRLLKLKRFIRGLLYRWAANKVDGFVAISDEVRESMIKQLGAIQDKIITISNGVDMKRYRRPGNKIDLCHQLGLPTEACLAMVVGRLTKQKGHTYLIEAAPAIVNCHPNTHFLFVGVGELKEALQAQVQQVGLSENIHFLGNRSDVPDLLASVDLFVLPSLWEGLAMALLEAMAAGKPIVATVVSGTSQVMVHGQTGLLVPPGDSQALAQAIIQLLANPAQAQMMGQAAQKHVELNYSAQKQASEHLTLYRRLLI